MSDYNLSGKISLDTTDFKESVNELNRQIRAIESEFRAAAAGMGDWDQSAQGLEMRIDALNGKIELQKNKIGALGNGYKKIVEEKGATSQAAQSLEIKLNEATESLNRMKNELASSEVSLSKMTDGSQKAGEQVNILYRQIVIIKTGFLAAVAGMKDWGKSSEELKKRIGELTGQIDLQKQKVSGLESEYHKVSQEKGSTSKAAQELEIKLNKETETLNKMQRELDSSEKSLSKVGKESKNAGDKTDGLQKAENQASNAAEKLGSAMGSLKNKMASAAGGIGNMVTKVTKLATGLAVGLVGATSKAIDGITQLASTTIGPASDFNETISKTQMVFGEAAEQVMAFGEGAATGLGMSSNAALSAAGTYGNLFRSMGIAEQTSADMSVSLVQLATDLASFNKMDPTDVLEKLRAGLTGDAESLKTLGIDINQTTLEAKAMELGLIGVGEELTASAKAQAAYALMLEQSTLAQGDFERNSQENANQQLILQAQLENTRKEIGNSFLPIITLGISLLNRFLASPQVQEGLDRLVAGIQTMTDYLTTAFAGDDPFEAVRNGLDTLGERFPIIDHIVGGVESLVAKFGELKAGFESGGFSGLFEALLPEEGMEGVLEGMAEKVGELLSKLLTSAATKPAMMLDIGLKMFNGLAEALSTAIPNLLPVVIELLTSFVQFITESLPLLLPGAILIIQSLLEFIVSNISLLIQAGIEIVTTLVEGILPMLPLLVEAALEIIITLANSIAEALPELIPAVLKIIPQIVLILLENLPQLIEAALELILALAEGLIAALPILLPYIPRITQAIFDAIIEALPLIGEAAVELIMTLVNGIMNSLPEIGNVAVETMEIYINGLLNYYPKIREVGANIVTGVWEGISSKAAWFGEQISGFFSNIVNGARNILDEHSPSGVFADIGENMALGLGIGFTGQFRDIERNVRSAVGGLSGSVSLSVDGNATSGDSSSKSTVYQLGGIHIHVPAGSDTEKIGKAAEVGVLRALKAAGAA